MVGKRVITVVLQCPITSGHRRARLESVPGPWRLAGLLIATPLPLSPLAGLCRAKPSQSKEGKGATGAAQGLKSA